MDEGAWGLFLEERDLWCLFDKTLGAPRNPLQA
jgi:hypothetical protein